MDSLGFFIDVILRLHCAPGFNSAININGCQKNFGGSKGGRCIGLTILPSSWADCLEILEASTSWSLKGM